MKKRKNNSNRTSFLHVTCVKKANQCYYCKVELFSSQDKQHHVCEQHHYKTVDQQRKDIKRKNTDCTHGDNCFRKAKNRCWFKHSQPINLLPHQEQGHDSRPQLYCRYQDRCFKGLECKFKHFPGGFLLTQQQQNQQ